MRMRIGWLPGRMLLVGACVILLLGGISQPTSGETHGEQTITGEVFAEGYGGEGEVSAVSIYDGAWGTVLVSPDGQGSELLTMVGELVEATGEIEETVEGDYIMVVKSYRVVKEDQGEPDSYDEDE